MDKTRRKLKLQRVLESRLEHDPSSERKLPDYPGNKKKKKLQ